MTQLFMEDGRVIPVTVVKAVRNVVTQIRNNERDGYVAVQVGTTAGSKHIKKPQKGHCKGIQECGTMREFRVLSGQVPSSISRGLEFGVEIFRPGDSVQVTGMSKGRGFQGVVKRHNFAGAPASHGTKDQLRMPGSIGATGPAHVFKGQRMPGRMGNDRITIKGLKIVKVDTENGLLYIKGALPGAFNAILSIQGPGTFKIVNKTEEKDTVEGLSEDNLSEEVTTSKKENENEEKENEPVEIEKEENAESVSETAKKDDEESGDSESDDERDKTEETGGDKKEDANKRDEEESVTEQKEENNKS